MMAIFTQKLNRQTKITFTTNFQNSILKNIKRNKKKMSLINVFQSPACSRCLCVLVLCEDHDPGCTIFTSYICAANNPQGLLMCPKSCGSCG